MLYTRLAAVNYAVRWALSRNPAFENFSGQGHGGDCTNFISQCLYAGGWTMNDWGSTKVLVGTTIDPSAARVGLRQITLHPFLKGRVEGNVVPLTN